MKNFLIAFLLLQGTAQDGGTVTGIVRSADGKPAAGVRVYALPAPVAAEDGAATVFESIGETDDAGRYRLEVPAGRYYIAAGSVSSPTYFPGSPTVAGARVLTIAPGSAVDDVDFDGYVPPTRRQNFAGLMIRRPPGSTGVLSGVLRYPDGAPAVGVYVSVGLVSGGPALPVGPGLVAQTDSSGRYRLESIPPGTYYLAAGFADFPVFHPGTENVFAATQITTTPATRMDTLDFTIPRRPQTKVSGRVLGAGGVGAAGAHVTLFGGASVQVPSLQLPSSPRREIRSSLDGSFEFESAPAGTYTLEATLSGIGSQSRTVAVIDQPQEGLDFFFSAPVVRGRVLDVDDSPSDNFQDLGRVVVSSLDSPNLVKTTLIPIDAGGAFSAFIEPGTFRLRLSLLPDDYVVEAMTSGVADLLQEPFRTSDSPIDVEVRLRKRMESPVTLRGRLLDSWSGGPAPAVQARLCCFENSPFSRLSTPVRSDGSFEFHGVPAGSYTVEAIGSATLAVVASRVEVESRGVTDVTLQVRQQPAASGVNVEVRVEGFPQGERVRITFENFMGVFSSRVESGATLFLPAGNSFGSDGSYRVTVSEVPDAYIIRSVKAGESDLLSGGRLILLPQGPRQAGAQSPVVITLVARE